MSELQECYSNVTGTFGAGGTHYDVLGHRGTDYERHPGEGIIAYDDMVVEFVGSTPGLGNVVGLRRKNIGGYAGFAHCVSLPPKGVTIPKGNVIAGVAGWGDNHGSLWIAPHIHTTESSVSALNAALGIRPLTDPEPTIYAAVFGSSTAGGGSSKPVPSTSAATREPLMRYFANSASSDGLVRKGDSFLQGADGPLRLLGADETNAYQYNDNTGRPTPYAEWSGNKVRGLIKITGLRQYDGKGKLTGKVVY